MQSCTLNFACFCFLSFCYGCSNLLLALVTVSSPSFDAVFFSDIIRSVNPAIAAHARPNKTRVIQHSTNYGSIAIQTGGVAYNMAVAAASFGATVKFATIVGEDIFGKIIVDNLNRHGIVRNYF